MLNRRNFLKMLGQGTAGLFAAINMPMSVLGCSTKKKEPESIGAVTTGYAQVEPLDRASQFTEYMKRKMDRYRDVPVEAKANGWYVCDLIDDRLEVDPEEVYQTAVKAMGRARSDLVMKEYHLVRDMTRSAYSSTFVAYPRLHFQTTSMTFDGGICYANYRS